MMAGGEKLSDWTAAPLLPPGCFHLLLLRCGWWSTAGAWSTQPGWTDSVHWRTVFEIGMRQRDEENNSYVRIGNSNH